MATCSMKTSNEVGGWDLETLELEPEALFRQWLCNCCVIWRVLAWIILLTQEFHNQAFVEHCTVQNHLYLWWKNQLNHHLKKIKSGLIKIVFHSRDKNVRRKNRGKYFFNLDLVGRVGFNSFTWEKEKMRKRYGWLLWIIINLLYVRDWKHWNRQMDRKGKKIQVTWRICKSLFANNIKCQRQHMWKDSQTFANSLCQYQSNNWSSRCSPYALSTNPVAGSEPLLLMLLQEPRLPWGWFLSQHGRQSSHIAMQVAGKTK